MEPSIDLKKPKNEVVAENPYCKVAEEEFCRK
jgi:hypothetical protein